MVAKSDIRLNGTIYQAVKYIFDCGILGLKPKRLVTFAPNTAIFMILSFCILDSRIAEYQVTQDENGFLDT